MQAFSDLGIICGVIQPKELKSEALKQADIVILDWQLGDDTPDRALGLLRELLSEDSDRNALRLVAIYTAEPELSEIYGAVFATLKNAGLAPKQDSSQTTISYRHGRIVLYLKPDAAAPSYLDDRRIAERDLPKALLRDFSSMTAGLLPGIALPSLAAVREGAHMVLIYATRIPQRLRGRTAGAV